MKQIKKLLSSARTNGQKLLIGSGRRLWWLASSAGAMLVSSLQAEKAPYVVTLFVAALGWTALRTSDRLLQTPFVEYQTKKDVVPHTGSGKYALVQLRNVTTIQSYECFLLEFVGPSSAFDSGATNFHIAYNGTVAVNVGVITNSDSNWRFKVQDFMPGADVVVGVLANERAPFRVMVRPCEATPSVDPKDESKAKRNVTPVLLERSFHTWYVEYELLVLWVGLLLWLLMLVCIHALKPAIKAPQA